jgi:hypothetical protein
VSPVGERRQDHGELGEEQDAVVREGSDMSPEGAIEAAV